MATQNANFVDSNNHNRDSVAIHITIRLSFNFFLQFNDLWT